MNTTEKSFCVNIPFILQDLSNNIKGTSQFLLLELNGMVDIQVLPSTQLIFPFKAWFFGIYLNFQWQKSLKI